MCVVVPQDFFPLSDCCFDRFVPLGRCQRGCIARVSLLTFWRYKMTRWLCSSNTVSSHVTLSDTLSDRQPIKSGIELAGCNFESYRLASDQVRSPALQCLAELAVASNPVLIPVESLLNRQPTRWTRAGPGRCICHTHAFTHTHTHIHTRTCTHAERETVRES